MFRFLPAPLLGVLAGILHLLNLLFIPLLVILVAILRYLMPIPSLRRKLIYVSHEVIPPLWTDMSNFIMWLTSKIEWDVQGVGELKRYGWYFVVSNHQSWLDIIVLEKVFQRKIPMLKFFMKQQLLWTLPVAGLACYMMGFPFMKRYSKSYLKKHPEKIGVDVESTRRACEKFKHQPIAVINFLEGTRYSLAKHQRQASPYQHLLKPKAGGLAFVLSALQEHLDAIVDVTIIYPENNINLWRFLSGKVNKIIVRYEVLPVAVELQGDYYNDPKFRTAFQVWLNQRWQLKDQLIKQISEKQ